MLRWMGVYIVVRYATTWYTVVYDIIHSNTIWYNMVYYGFSSVMVHYILWYMLVHYPSTLNPKP